MRSAAAALASEFHRYILWPLGALVIYFTAIAWLVPAFYPDLRVQIVPLDGSGTLFVVPLTYAGMYFLAVFTYGLRGDVAARPSIYPPRTFTMPVATTTLAWVPMAYGGAVMVALWLMTALFARWPFGIELPIVWPALLGAVILSWAQALTWMPYGWPWIRIIATAGLLATLDAIVITGFHYEISEAAMIAFLAPQLPLAYVTARAAVSRARRGHVPEWGRPFDMIRWPAATRSHAPFASASRAQSWYEWRRHGWTLPAMVALVVPFELGLLFVPVIVEPVFLLKVLGAVLLTPPVLAGVVAATVRRANPHAADGAGLTQFDATRPVTAASLVGAKLTMAFWSTLVAWLVVAVAIPPALVQSDTWQPAIDRLSAIAAFVGTPRAIVLTLLIVAALFVSTWKRLVQSLYIGLGGRLWLARASGLVALVVVIGAGPMLEWIGETPGARIMLFERWPWILAALVAIKMTAAALVAPRLVSARLVSDRALILGAAAWTVAVLALYQLLVWLMDTALIPPAVLLMMAILAVPLARLSAAPLALTWNRHR